MTTLTVNIKDKKSEKAVKAVLDALGISYDINADGQKTLTKAEQKVYNGLKKSFEEIKLHQEGKIKLQDAREMLNEL